MSQEFIAEEDIVKDAPEIIYLIDMGDELVWCADPAPEVGMDKKDAIQYIRSDFLKETLIEAIAEALGER